ncbi:glycosyltransferase involved in cell wall biosynthesis [Croceifilum oryzae]|uniref:Glycosyltransferase involved in cell wall biosynthesis n=1 Tax=Croceifilum oryzae TaxID=1553429 RepID=A0AAJ1WRY1_9BACL|nr:glycosyltransferase family 2 protein [Croceifilum oryzae]MDQ0417070.1 glycosyltransferase involved in cell wall biosynthesis [Croceifilum oryzae]
MSRESYPLVSVLIPAYNRPDTLKIALNSILDQTYPNIEVIICDDSSDNRVSEMIAADFYHIPQIRYFKNEENLFIGNWHKCFDLSSGEYINYLMDDDVFHKEKIAAMMSYYLRFENITLVTSYRQTIDAQGAHIPPIWATQRLYQEDRVMDGKMLGNYALSHCLNVIGEPTTVLFRKSDLIDRYGFYQGKQYVLLNDMAAWLSLLSKGKAVYITDALSYFRLHPNQNNETLGANLFSEWLDLMIASREDGFLDSDHLYQMALGSYRDRISGYPAFTKDIERIDGILSSL